MVPVPMMLRLLTSLNRATLLVLAGTLSLPRQPGPATAPVPDFTIVAGDYYLRLPASVPAGWRTVRFHNEGREFHHAVFLRVRSLEGAQTALAALEGWQEDHDRPVPGALSVGGVEGSFGPALDGEGAAPDTYATVELHPGLYLVVCMIPTDRRLHVTRGMHALLRVVASDRGRPPSPAATLRMAEYTYSLTPHTLRPGWRQIEVVNTGTAEHVAEILRLKAHRKAVDLFAQAPDSADDPVEATVGGSTRLAAGARAFIWIHLAAGTYVIQCPLRTAAHQSHLRRGMLLELVVSAD